MRTMQTSTLNAERPAGRRLRGLTMIEVLASLVLLSLIAATCIPMLRAAAIDDTTLAAGDPEHDEALADLAGVVDQALAQWREGESDETDPQSIASAIAGSLDASEGEINMGVLELAGESANVRSIWIVFRRDGLQVVRWLPRPSDEDDEASFEGERP